MICSSDYCILNNVSNFYYLFSQQPLTLQNMMWTISVVMYNLDVEELLEVYINTE